MYAVDPIGGAGRSVQTAPLRDVNDLTAWLLDLLDGLNAPAAHLVGYSYGGWYALHTARHVPDRVATLTLLESGGFAPLAYGTTCGAYRCPASATRYPFDLPDQINTRTLQFTAIRTAQSHDADNHLIRGSFESQDRLGRP